MCGVTLGRFGLWSRAFRHLDQPATRRSTISPAEAATEAESAGYAAAWFPGGAGRSDFAATAARLLAATRTLAVCVGVLSIWDNTAASVTGEYHGLVTAHGDRVIVGFGVSHGPLVDGSRHGRYHRPLTALDRYLNELDARPVPLPSSRRVLGGLGRRTLERAAHRAVGAHPYLVTPGHTAMARKVMGPKAWLAPAQKVVLETDPVQARKVGREHLATYLALPNYRKSLLSQGFASAELDNGGSDELIDAVVPWGTPEALASRLRRHLEAGADHVAVEVLPDDNLDHLVLSWLTLAPALVGSAPEAT